MIGFQLPSSVWVGKRYGVMLSDQTVTLVTWKSGKFEVLGEFVNDTQGLNDFTAFLKTRGKEFEGKAMHITISVVGEDYRFERVAHLVGKYKTDMLARKFQQLFRGSTYHLASFQGREPVGRRQDMYLFCGILSSDKVQPWVRDLTRAGFSIAGIHLASMASKGLYKLLVKDTQGVNVISVSGEEGSVRHNFFVDGQMRFSRLSRVPATATADQVLGNIRAEIEKTVAYLASMKLVQPNTKVGVHLVTPDDMMDEMSEAAARTAGERVTVSVSSARLSGIALGIKKPMVEYGRDSSLVVHEVMRSINFTQLAPFTDIRNYVSQMASRVIVAAVLLWGVVNLSGIGFDALNTYNNYASENVQLESTIAQLEENYRNQVAGFGTPPSSPANMRSAVNVLDNVASGEGVGPGKLMLYLSKMLENSRTIQIDSLSWYISNDRYAPTGDLAFANGRETFEVVEISGFLDPDVNSEFAYGQYRTFIDTIKSRPDMTVTENVAPALLEAGGELVLEIDNFSDIRSELNKFTNNNFSVAVAWEPQLSAQQARSQ